MSGVNQTVWWGVIFPVIFLGVVASCQTSVASDESLTNRPNILWIVVEDASPHIGCYGEETIRTPNLDALADRGIRFTNAFVTCPVCSPSRSAMVTGVFQTTLGAHNHRSQTAHGKGRGNELFFDSYRLAIPSIPRLFKDAGYYTCNSSAGMPNSSFGKTDYNFIWESSDYDGADWQQRRTGQPFFAQVQLRGGKNRQARQHATDPQSVRLPSYYPDHPNLRDDWAAYLDSWVQCDQEVRDILDRLEREQMADETAVFFWTDHGVSHMRGKQFLYEEGIRVPLIIRLPEAKRAGTQRDDLVTHIDIAATSLALAGIEIPDHVQGNDLLASDYHPREMVFSARDRCDETVDMMRCVRTHRFKYIRNFLPHLTHAQPNQYKDSKLIVRTLRQLHAENELSDSQSRVFLAPRASEELYDLHNDPLETNNLAPAKDYQEVVRTMREALYDWMISSKDLGLIPEPILEDMGGEHGSKYEVLRQEKHKTLARDVLEVIEAGEAKQFTKLLNGLQSPSAAIRYWCATLLGIYGERHHAESLASLKQDVSGGVRVAVALALVRLGQSDEIAPMLIRELDSDNYIVGLYAIRALEMMGDDAKPYLADIQSARNSDYEFTRRIANRLVAQLQ